MTNRFLEKSAHVSVQEHLHIGDLFLIRAIKYLVWAGCFAAMSQGRAARQIGIMQKNRVEAIDLDRVIFDPEYRRAVIEALAAQRQAEQSAAPAEVEDTLGDGTHR